ncbi:MAG: HAD-IIA family hydrolase [Blautia sp.]|jgi:4-nitrophenyl phosphatase|nr:HAD-IIA family hydrolase [Blautia sp.]
MLDYTGKSANKLKEKTLYLLDMDGTIYNENEIFDGTLEFLEEIERRDGQYVFITNNSSKSVEDYVQKVRAMGIKAEYENFYTSGQATAMYLKENYPNQVVYCMGTKSLIKELREAGIEVVTEVDERAGVVLLGFDTENTSEKIRNTCIMLGRDVAYLATNPDLVCPVSFGYIPDCGSMSIMLKNATGKEPFFIGKPEPIMVNCVLKKLNCKREDAVIIGDRLYTDIKTGANAQVDTICVLSGEASMEDILQGEVEPTYIFKSVKEIYEGLTEETEL